MKRVEIILNIHDQDDYMTDVELELCKKSVC